MRWKPQNLSWSMTSCRAWSQELGKVLVSLHLNLSLTRRIAHHRTRRKKRAKKVRKGKNDSWILAIPIPSQMSFSPCINWCLRLQSSCKLKKGCILVFFGLREDLKKEEKRGEKRIAIIDPVITWVNRLLVWTLFCSNFVLIFRNRFTKWLTRLCACIACRTIPTGVCRKVNKNQIDKRLRAIDTPALF